MKKRKYLRNNFNSLLVFYHDQLKDLWINILSFLFTYGNDVGERSSNAVVTPRNEKPSFFTSEKKE